MSFRIHSGWCYPNFIEFHTNTTGLLHMWWLAFLDAWDAYYIELSFMLPGTQRYRFVQHYLCTTHDHMEY